MTRRYSKSKAERSSRSGSSFAAIELYSSPTVEGAARHTRTPKLKPVIVIVASLVVIAAVIASLEIFPDYTYAFQTPVGVTFNASLNNTMAVQNQDIRGTFSVSNYFPFPNEPSNKNIFRATNLSMVGPCNSFESLFAAGVFQGRFDTQNISLAKRLPIWDEFSVWSCPAQPVDIVPRLRPFQTFTGKIDFNGYWTAGITNYPSGSYSEGIIHPFAPGIYTFLAADAWGHAEFLYFWVKAA